MKIALIGCDTLTTAQAKSFAISYCAKIRQKYTRDLQVVTVRQDELGRQVRIAARKLNIHRRTVDQDSFTDSDAEALAAGQCMWIADRVVILTGGSSKSRLSIAAVEIATRMSKRTKLIRSGEWQ